MPFFTPDDIGTRSNITAEPDIPARPTGDAIAAAAFRQNNPVVSIATSLMNSGPFEAVEGHNPLDTIGRGSVYEQRYLERFIGSRSPAEDRSIMGRIDAELADRKTLQAGGGSAVLFEMLAGILDPTLALPAGTLIKAGRAGYSTFRSAASVGIAGGAQMAVQEAALQASQETRTLGESALAVGSGTLLASLIGAGAARLLTRAETKALTELLDAEREAIDAHALGLDARAPADPGAPPLIPAQAPQPNRLEQLLSSTADAQAVGAAASDTRELRLAGFGIDKVPVLGKFVEKWDPMSRLFGSESAAARRATADLAETPLRMEQNLRGEVTTNGPALSRLATMQINQTRVAVADEFDRLYSEYRFGAAEVTAPRLRAQWERFQGRGEGYMTYDEFKREIAVALQSGDQHDIPQVMQAAQTMRAKVFEPWKKRAIEAGLLSEDVNPAGAESYFTRVYNKQAIAAKRPEFVDRVFDHLKGDQTTKAAAKARLEGAAAELGKRETQVARLESRVERLQAKQDEIGARLDERAMEVRRQVKRGDTLAERQGTIEEDLAEIDGFIRDMRREVSDPALLARLDDMEKEAAALRREDRPVTEADLDRVEQQELRGILTGIPRLAAQMMTGRRTWPKAPSFVSWIVANGGIKDVGGDVASVMGGKRGRPGMINPQGRTLDEWGEKLANEFPGAFPHIDETGSGHATPSQVLEFIDEAMRGRQPAFWMEALSKADKDKIDAAKFAAGLEEVFTRAGIEAKTPADVAKVLRDGNRAGVTLDDLDRIAAELESAGQDIPVTFRRQGVEDQIDVDRATITRIRETIRDSMRTRDQAKARLRVTEGRVAEQELGERASRGRLGVLADRLDRGEARRELLADAIEVAGKMRDDVRVKIEAELAAWQGKSTAEAKSALKARDKYEADTAQSRTERLTSADTSIDRVVKRILASDRDLTDAELRDKAHQITDRIIGSPDGRLPYDLHQSGPETAMRGDSEARGPLQARDFAIPDAVIRDFLETDAEHIAQTYLRTMVPDVLLTERFGDIRMTETFRKINDDYAALSDRAKSKKDLVRLESERQTVIQKIALIRDRLRGVYGISADAPMRNVARFAAAAKNFNVITSMGMATISSLPDLAGPVFRHGLGAVFSDAWAPFLRFMTSTGDERAGSVWKEAGRQYRAMGIATETMLASRAHELADIEAAYRPQSRVERTLQWGADKFQILNGMALWTDWAKINASMVAGSEILRATEAVAKGKATKKQLTALAESNIDLSTADRIWRAFETGGEVRDGVHLPNTADWADMQARTAFEGAVAREADIAVITPGQEKPGWMSDPILSIFGQFKSFTAAATQRILIANLQRHDANVLSGLMVSMGLGMMSYKINSLFGGVPTSDRPQDWIKEGIARGGVLGWLEEGNSITSKLTRGGLDIHRVYGADKPLSRFVALGAFDQILGPTAGKIKDAIKATSAGASGEWTHGDTTALRRLTVGQNLFWLRGLFNQVEAGANNAFGIEPKPAPRSR